MDLPTTHYDTMATNPARAHEPKVESVTKKEGILSRISFYLILISAFLAPLVFIPSLYAPIDVVKSFFLAIMILVAALLSTIDAVRTKSFSFPKSAFGYAGIAIILSTIISVFTSGSVGKSFIGQGFELTSASFIFLMIVAAYLVSRLVIRDRETIFKIYSAIFISFVLLALFHIARFFGGADFMSFGILKTVTASLVGKWYDFAALVGAVGFLSLIGIKFLPLQKSLRRLLVVSLVICGLILFVVNSLFIWVLVAISTLAIAIYEYFITAPKGTGLRNFTSRISILTVIVLVVAIVCAWKGEALAGSTVTKYQAQYGELVLPWQMTLDITSDTLKQTPVWGAGPNRFGLQYLRYKPVVINQTPFWNAEFSSGFGFIPTLLVTQGIVGGVVWLLFLALFLREGIRALRRVTDPLKRFFVASSFFTAFFLWLIDLTYVPSHVTLFLTAIFTGIFVALAVSESVIGERVIAVRQNIKLSKLVPVALYAAVVVLVIWIGTYAQKAVALTYFQKGIKELSIGKSVESAQAKFKKALTWDTSDAYYRALSETNILKINTLAQEIQTEAQSGATPDPKKGEQLVALITDSVKYSKSAQNIDPTNYYNYLAEARISEIGTSLKIENAYGNAKVSYAEAIKNNPFNPGLYLNLARLEASQGNLKDAQQYIGRALQLKPNYLDAVFFLSQLQVANNQLEDAMVSTQVAIQLNPQEPLLFFQYGILAYNAKDYGTAIKALEEATRLNKDYANAKYFLGLSYARLGRNADAITQFEQLAVTNPENQEVAFILSNLKEGKSPFADAKPPIDSKPEKRKDLPVTEKEEATTVKTPAKTTTTTPKKK